VTEETWWGGKNARVFISCGQASTEERHAAETIRAELERSGYSAYVAVQVHSPQGLTENIYRRLTTAEYLLFIDFRRDRLPRRRGEPVFGQKKFRGSLFSNQELAIASYLRADLLPLLQRGVKREGILDFIQGNPVEFEDPSELPGLVREEIGKSGWDPNHRRELTVEIWPTLPPPAGISSSFPRTYPSGVYQYHELGLRNIHRLVMATDCFVQIVAVRGPSYPSGQDRDVIEMKFKHMTSPWIVLPAGEVRQVDGVLVLLNGSAPFALPGILNPGHVDSEDIVQQYAMRTPGDHEIDLQVHSREFGTQKMTILFHFDSVPANCRLSLRGGPAAPVGAGGTAPLASAGAGGATGSAMPPSGTLTAGLPTVRETGVIRVFRSDEQGTTG
jgi:hypothetical protein